MFRRNIAHPVIRQFILRTAVLNYLGKCLQRQWSDWSRLNAQLTKTRRLKDKELLGEGARQKLAQLQSRAAASHRLLQREYNELFNYMMDKRDLWDSPEYFKAKTALGTANHNLLTFVPRKRTD
ncbi:uncharacterized protein [Drosophila kikkawai]|uniref:Uncharacterized protein n=1 Tax=Drosophila kikkawai TaxID=30033 RepID=A0A6P4IX15_DROKI|nr:uncharacterized protein LOC108077856 [Drosophila kikkawai]KAH8341967.1 hypothetical protein KR059_006421 [Drosophila kikkawai]